jgi:exosome complex component RRP42
MKMTADTQQILLLSAPLSYPLPLLSLTTHLALQHTQLPALISEQDEDPLFNDDWEAAVPLYTSGQKPPITLLLASVGPGINLPLWLSEWWIRRRG